MKKFLQQLLTMNGYEIAEAAQQQLLAYLDLMQRWNQVFNLTAIDDPKQMVLLHLIDSLSIRDYLHGNQIIDVGSGAGLPGIPLALTCPDKQFVLLDSNNKKTRFLNQVCYELSIPNVTVVQERAESFHPEHCFDSIITRAFSNLKNMLEATGHLLGEGGRFLAMKGNYPTKEIAEIPNNFTLLAVHKLTIKGLDAARHLVCIERKGAIRG